MPGSEPLSETVQADQTTTAVVPLGPNFPIARQTGNDVVGGKPGIAFDGTNFLVPYFQGSDIYARRVTPDGVVLDSPAITISAGLNDAVAAPSVGFDGVNYVVVWCAARSGAIALYGARVAPAGTVLDPGGVQITTGTDLKIRMPGMAFDGTNFLVAWRTNGDQIYAARVTPALQNLDTPGGFPIATGGTAYYPGVAFDGVNFLVVWHDGRNTWSSGWDIYGALVTPQGNVLHPEGFVICDEPLNQEHSSVGFDGTNYLVAWYDWRPKDDQIYGSAFAARVSPAGVVLDKPAFQIADRSMGQYAGPKVICGEGGCLVVWNTGNSDLATKFRLSDVWARRIAPSGELLDLQGVPVATSFGHQFGAIAGYGEGRYLVAWRESTGRELVGAVYGQVLAEQPLPLTLPNERLDAQMTGQKTDDSSWIVESAPVSAYAAAGLALSDGSSYAFGIDQALQRKNGVWQSNEIFPNGYIYGSWASDADNIWTAGWCRGFDRFDGQDWLDEGCLIGMDRWGIITAIWGSDPATLWATADSGDLLKYEGDHHWTTIASGLPYDLADLWGTAASNIYAVGERGTVLHYNGNTWEQETGIPTVQRLNAIWGSGPNDIYAVGDWGTILHFDGSSWRSVESGTLQDLYDVWGLSGSNVYAVGLGGAILHGNGTSWVVENSGTDMDLVSVWGGLHACRLTVWASGSDPQILMHEAPVNCTFLPVVQH